MYVGQEIKHWSSWFINAGNRQSLI